MFATHVIAKERVFRSYKEVIQISQERQKKNGQKIRADTSQKRKSKTTGKSTNENVPNCISSMLNANGSSNMSHITHTSYGPKVKSLVITGVGDDMKQQKFSNIASGNENWYKHLGKVWY